MPLKLNHLEKKYLIAAPVFGGSDLVSQAKKARLLGAGIIELRIDLFRAKELQNIIPLTLKIKQSARLPILATVRSTKEQGPVKGFLKLNDLKRKEIYEKVMPYIDLVDIELGSDKINRSVIKTAHQMRKNVILSYHNFRSAPSQNEINILAKKFRSLGGDMLKIVATPRNNAELTSFMLDCSNLKNILKIFFAMGELGRVSRIIGFSFGSCLTYGSVKNTTAPGQISVKKLNEYRKKIYL